MDASASTDAEAASVLARARRAGDLPQRLGLMSHHALAAPDDGAFFVGPLKILLDDHDLPPLDDLLEAIADARSQDRRVAVHCVTAAELALTLAAFETAGALAGDRIEHGGMIPVEAVPAIVQLGLTVVTQPGFVFERGDRYLDEIDPGEHGDLYRCASLLAAGAPVASSSDAPYSALDPWAAMRAAAQRRTRTGRAIGLDERVSPARALGLYAGGFAAPGGPPRKVAPGHPADLCLLGAPLKAALRCSPTNSSPPRSSTARWSGGARCAER
jgi:predicted amidohydrolase YtcJ